MNIITLITLLFTLILPACEDFDSPPTDNDFEDAVFLQVEVGENVEVPFVDEGIEKSYSSTNIFLPTLSAGQYRDYTITINANEIPNAWAIPINETGNLDVRLYRGTVLVSSSSKPVGYVERILLPPASYSTGTYLIRFLCMSGTCSYSGIIGKSDNNKLTRWLPYENQRSHLNRSGRCRINGVTQADGECACADASAAMQITADGKRRLSDKKRIVDLLFPVVNTGADGAAIADNLKNLLTSSYGYSNCYYASGSSLYSQLQSALQSGFFVVMSLYMNTGGHFVSVHGFDTSISPYKVLISDPYGALSGTTWSSFNGTTDSSSSGANRWINWSALSPNRALICY